MKKIIVALIAISMILVTTTTMAVKPTGAGAENVPWNLSGAVMPSPPWGLSDIPGSDSASKLIVNQPNGNVEVTVTGVMNGLTPNTVYTVYPSNAWSTHWDITGDWVLDFDYLGTLYIHDMTVTDNVFTGTGGYPASGPPYSITWTVAGTINGDSISFKVEYDSSTYYVDAIGTIASDGTMSGTWSNPSQSGTWSSSSGNAVTVGNGWPGLFNNLETFTFTTDEFGAGSWHFNLKNADFPEGEETYTLSIWINKGGTILISDNFNVAVD